jgi:hypothetical protein
MNSDWNYHRQMEESPFWTDRDMSDIRQRTLFTIFARQIEQEMITNCTSLVCRYHPTRCELHGEASKSKVYCKVKFQRLSIRFGFLMFKSMSRSQKPFRILFLPSDGHLLSWSGVTRFSAPDAECKPQPISDSLFSYFVLERMTPRDLPHSSVVEIRQLDKVQR